MKRRFRLPALLVGTCVALVSRVTLAQDAPAAPPPAEGAKPPEGEKPAEGAKPEGEKPAEPGKPAEESAPAQPAEQPAAEPETPAEAPPAPPPAEAAPAPAAPAPAAPAQAAAATADASAEAQVEAAGPTDELPDAGYIPGYRNHPSLSLSPWHPPTPGFPGLLTVPFGAPAPSDTWNFNFTGFFSAALRAAIETRRTNAGSEDAQSETVLKTPPVTADCYQCFTGTGGVLGSWVQMNFEYGNKTTTARTSLNTYAPSRPISYTQISSQYFIGDAYLTFRVPQIDKFRLAWAVGAFTISYGQLGQYGNLYGGTFLGSIGGVGELLLAEYDLTPTLTLQAEHGVFGRYGKAPNGVLENQSSGWADPADPAPWMTVARLGVVRTGETVIQGGLVFMYNWAQDDLGREPPPLNPPGNQDVTPYDETNPLDPSLAMYGLETRVRGPWYHFGLAAGLLDATEAWNLHGMQFWVAGDGEAFSNNWLGIEASGNGTMWGAGTEFRLGWGALMRAPEPFFGEGWDVQSALAVQVGAVNPDSDNEARDVTMYKLALDNRAKFIKWLALGLRVDRVVPDTDDGDRSFWTLSPRVEFQTNWNSHEIITLQYAHWFYGDEVPFTNNNANISDLDSDVVSFGFGFWW